MDNKRLQTDERPIEKPDNPLPALFNPRKRSELPTRRKRKGSDTLERAHFFRKRTNPSGSPVYDFVITREN